MPVATSAADEVTEPVRLSRHHEPSFRDRDDLAPHSEDFLRRIRGHTQAFEDYSRWIAGPDAAAGFYELSTC